MKTKKRILSISAADHPWGVTAFCYKSSNDKDEMFTPSCEACMWYGWQHAEIKSYESTLQMQVNFRTSEHTSEHKYAVGVKLPAFKWEKRMDLSWKLQYYII